MSASITSFNIKGERCTGTTYLQKLIENNLGCSYIPHTGWKHGYLTYTTKVWNIADYAKTFLTIVISRNVIDWVRSFYMAPHHLPNVDSGVWLPDHKPSFSEFIRREVYQVGTTHNGELVGDRHPFYLHRPRNILEMRNWKTEHFLYFSKVLPNVHYVRYEDLAADPARVIAEINDRWFGVDYQFKNWTKYKYNDWNYKPKKYFTIRDENLAFIRDNINWDLEAKMGYTLDF